MTGDVSNVQEWAGADVVIGDLTATFVPGTLFAAGAHLDFLGILDPGGFSESQANDSNAVNGWGYGEVATRRSNNVITCQVTAIEDNLVNLGLRYDTTGMTAADDGPGYSGTLKQRDLTRKVKLGFQLQSNGMLKQRFTKAYAQIDAIGDAVESETGVPMTVVTFKIYKTSIKEYWDVYFGVYPIPSS